MTEQLQAAAGGAMTAGAAEAEPIEVPAVVLAANLLKKLDDNPGMRAAAIALLGACAEERQEETALLGRVEVALTASNEMPVQPLSAVVDLLVRDGARRAARGRWRALRRRSRRGVRGHVDSRRCANPYI